MPIQQPTQQEVLAFGNRIKETGLEYRVEPFKLRAGGESHWYFDGRQVLAEPSNLKTASQFVLAKAAERGMNFNAVAGMGVGGTALSHGTVHVGTELGMRLYFVDGEDSVSPGQRYGYGLHGLVVSHDTDVLVVDDTASTGDSLETLMSMIDKARGHIVGAIALLDRSEGSVTTRLAARSNPVEFHSLYDFHEDTGAIIPSGVAA